MSLCLFCFTDYSFEYISLAVGVIGLAVEGMFLQWWFDTMVGVARYKYCTVQPTANVYILPEQALQ